MSQHAALERKLAAMIAESIERDRQRCEYQAAADDERREYERECRENPHSFSEHDAVDPAERRAIENVTARLEAIGLDDDIDPAAHDDERQLERVERMLNRADEPEDDPLMAPNFTDAEVIADEIMDKYDEAYTDEELDAGTTGGTGW